MVGLRAWVLCLCASLYCISGSVEAEEYRVADKVCASSSLFQKRSHVQQHTIVQHKDDSHAVDSTLAKLKGLLRGANDLGWIGAIFLALISWAIALGIVLGLRRLLGWASARLSKRVTEAEAAGEEVWVMTNRRIIRGIIYVFLWFFIIFSLSGVLFLVAPIFKNIHEWGIWSVLVLIGMVPAALAGRQAWASVENNVLKAKVEEIDKDIRQAFLDGHIRLLSCRWLLSAVTSAEPLVTLSRLQDMCPDAFLSIEDAVAAFDAAKVFVLSYGWNTAEHPDPKGVVLKYVIEFLRSELLKTHDISGFGLFWDFCSLPQPMRSALEDATFKGALKMMSNLYGSLYSTTVLKFPLPPLPEAERYEGYNPTAYDDRGWCIMEKSAAEIAAFYGKAKRSKAGELPKLIDISMTPPLPYEPSNEKPDREKMEEQVQAAKFTNGTEDPQLVMTQLKKFIAYLAIGGMMLDARDDKDAGATADKDEAASAPSTWQRGRNMFNAGVAQGGEYLAPST